MFQFERCVQDLVWLFDIIYRLSIRKCFIFEKFLIFTNMVTLTADWGFTVGRIASLMILCLEILWLIAGLRLGFIEPIVNCCCHYYLPGPIEMICASSRELVRQMAPTRRPSPQHRPPSWCRTKNCPLRRRVVPARWSTNCGDHYCECFHPSSSLTGLLPIARLSCRLSHLVIIVWSNCDWNIVFELYLLDILLHSESTTTRTHSTLFISLLPHPIYYLFLQLSTYLSNKSCISPFQNVKLKKYLLCKP